MMRAVANLSPELMLLTDSQDVAAVRDDLGQDAAGYDAFFVRVEGGEFVEVWGMVGIVPYLSKLVSRLLPVDKDAHPIIGQNVVCNCWDDDNKGLNPKPCPLHGQG